jgi:DNA mismatch endonuclease (patch repair protein)
MRANRRRDTRAEIKLRSELHRRGLRFRVDQAAHTGFPRADIVFPRARVAVFVDGCFWHSCPTHGVAPKTNPDYWRIKLARNAARDRRNDEKLCNAGWHVIRIWEHESPSDAADKVERAVRQAKTR